MNTPQMPNLTSFVSREDYKEMLRICDDRDLLPPTYDAFLAHSNNFIEGARKSGIDLVKVNIKPAELAEWCRANGKRINSETRAQYAIFVHIKTQNPDVHL